MDVFPATPNNDAPWVGVMTNPIPGADDFNGDDAALCQSIDALLSLDAEGALVPHGLGGHARKLLSIASLRLAAKVGANVAADIPTWRERRDEDIKLNGEAQANPLTYAAYEIADPRARIAAGAPAETPKQCDVCNGAYGHSLGCPEDDPRRDLGPSCTCPALPCPVHLAPSPNKMHPEAAFRTEYISCCRDPDCIKCHGHGGFNRVKP